MAPAAGNSSNKETRDLYRLSNTEEWWRDHHGLLVDHGYELRPRFRPGWIPSWTRNKKDPLLCEDGHPNLVRVYQRICSRTQPDGFAAPESH